MRRRAIAWVGLSGLGSAFVVACAGEPPSFPDPGPALDDTGETGGPASGAGDVEDEPGSTSADDVGTVGAHTGGPMGDGTAAGIDTGGSTGADSAPGDSSGGAATSDGSSSGAPAEDPWFTGHYEGTWGGSCALGFPVGNVDGDGTWSVDIDAGGTIVGTYEGNIDYVGNVDGTIVGTVDQSGAQTALAEGDSLGACSWDGQLQKNGSSSGDIDCAQSCGGSWQGSLQ